MKHLDQPDAGRVPPLFGRRVRRIHCLGVGGMGLGPLAIYLSQRGFEVSGEDDALTEEMRGLLERARVRIGTLPGDCDLVAYSSAIAPSHAAHVAAVARGLPLVRRGELLAEVTKDRRLVGVCGSHGKTTTTAMLITALRRAGFPAGYVLGGLLSDGTVPASAGANDWVVAEIDESDGTIEKFAPEITVAVNLDWDHPDHYRRLADLEAAFARLFRRTHAMVLTSAGCAMSARVVKEVQGGEHGPQTLFRTFGPPGDFRGESVSEDRAGMLLRLSGEFAPGEARVRAHGDFNASNATAALAVAQVMGVPLGEALLAEYAAVRRRQTILHDDGFTVVEDYAHHPAEIAALLKSLRRRVTGTGRLIVVFQPHRFSRTLQFKRDFAAALSMADRLHLLEVYPAGEVPLTGGTSADLQAELAQVAPALKPRVFATDSVELGQVLAAEVKPGDLVAFVGAGDIERVAHGWVGGLQGSGPAARWDGFVHAAASQVSAATKLRREEPLAKKTTMRVGGAARIYAEPANVADLQVLLRLAKAASIPVFALGRGSNLLIPDAGVDGLVVSLADEHWCRFEPSLEGRVWVGAGLRLKNLCGLAAKAGLVGFEFLEGIPASVGGALRMNAGAMGGWIFDVVEEVELITLDGEVKRLAKAAMHVDYRHCAELNDAIALGALLRPSSTGEAAAVRQQMDAYARKRHESQPREPSAGCIFKNPPGTSAGRVIDESGLKGERVGDAEVSPVHANFIVNRGSATCEDILELVRRVRARVKSARGIDLQPEVLLFGKRWEDVL